MIKIAIIEDHELVAEGLRRQIESLGEKFEIVESYPSGEAFLKDLRRNTLPDVCILDLALPGINGAEVLRTVANEFPELRVLVVSGADRPEIAARCISEGAQGFISKGRPGSEFLDALQAVANGKRYIDRNLFDGVITQLSSRQGAEPSFNQLSQREFVVMEKLAEGLSIKEIASLLNVNAKTVSTYRTRLLNKLNLKSNAELTAYCLKNGLIKMDVS